jgi:uncharacterized membrane protein YccF (DUF307 family)
MANSFLALYSLQARFVQGEAECVGIQGIPSGYAPVIQIAIVQKDVGKNLFEKDVVDEICIQQTT